jgi:diacylglycerol kinase
MNKNLNKELNLKSRVRSFSYAINGLQEFFATQTNAWIELIAMVVVLFFGFYYHISNSEWLSIIMAIGLVFTAEILNTAIEYLTDLVSPDHHPLAGKVKDLASAAVLFACIAALIIGVIIFSKYII